MPPEAAAAAYWLEHADVLVLPSAASKQDFNGVLDYLDVRDLPPVIVASLVAGYFGTRPSVRWMGVVVLVLGTLVVLNNIAVLLRA